MKANEEKNGRTTADTYLNVEHPYQVYLVEGKIAEDVLLIDSNLSLEEKIQFACNIVLDCPNLINLGQLKEQAIHYYDANKAPEHTIYNILTEAF